MIEETVSKAAFATLCSADKSRVTRWIAEGKISDEAIVGEGRKARIFPSIAMAQLRDRLDNGQRLGNGFGTRLAMPKPKTASAAVADDDEGVRGTSDEVDRKLKLSKLEASERANRMAALEEAAAAGTYVDATDARQEMGKIAAQMMTAFEGWLTEFATVIAGRYKLDQRDVRHCLHEVYREAREKAATAAARRAEGIPATIRTE